MWLLLFVASACIVKENQAFGNNALKMSAPSCRVVDSGYQLCFTKNQTRNELRVDCQLRNRPMGTAVTMLFQYEERGGEERKIGKSCQFSENIIGNYSCSLATDVTAYREGAVLKCYSNYKVNEATQKQKIQVFEIKEVTSAPGPVSQAVVWAAEPLLNCSGKSGYPKLAWFRDVNETLTNTMIENITRYDPGIFEASCILGCHNNVKTGEEWNLTWTLNGTVLHSQPVKDGGLVILKLTVNLSEDDDGKKLKCSLISEELYSGQIKSIVKKVTTIATGILQREVEKHRTDAIDQAPDDSSIAIWSVSIGVSLCLLAVLATLFFRRRRRRNDNVQSTSTGETGKKASVGVVYADLALSSPKAEFKRAPDNTEYVEIVGMLK